jgi:hypothetical protein
MSDNCSKRMVSMCESYYHISNLVVMSIEIPEPARADLYLRDHIVMTHALGTSTNHIFCFVVLSDVGSIDVAISELNGAPLFDRRVTVEMYHPPSKNAHKLDLTWGWHASTDSDPYNADVRGVATEPHMDIFAPVREQRRIGFRYIPSARPVKIGVGPWSSEMVTQTMYRLLHDFNVTSTAITRQTETLITGHRVKTIAVFVDFQTRDEAKRAQSAFDGRMYDGQRLEARP